MKKIRSFRICGLVLGMLASVLQGAFYVIKILGEVTNYSAQSLWPSFRIEAGNLGLCSYFAWANAWGSYPRRGQGKVEGSR